MEKKFINFENALIAFQAVQMILALNGEHVNGSVKKNRRYLLLDVYRSTSDEVILPDGYIYSSKDTLDLGEELKETRYLTTFRFYF